MKTIETLHAGASIIDITPPLEVGLLVSSVGGLYEPFTSVRLPLTARVLALGTTDRFIVVVALDLLALNDTSVEGWEEFKKFLGNGIPPEQIILCCTHTHSAPESGALSDLHLTAVFKNWLNDMRNKIREAIGSAVSNMRKCNLSLGTGELSGYSVQRRITTGNGVIMSDSVQPISDELMKREPVDRRVHAITIADLSGAAIATVIHAACHPVHEMCIPAVSPDFPGELCNVLKQSGNYGMPMFLNGACGNINPTTVSMGAEYARSHGSALANVVTNMTLEKMSDDIRFDFAHESLLLGIRPDTRVFNAMDAMVRLSVVRIGNTAIVFLPGEPFIELALQIEKRSPFENTIVTGFAENNVGYVPTIEAFDEGGYETGPGRWSYLEKNAAIKIIEQAENMLEELFKREPYNHDVYEIRSNN